jgi:hypothetical protein
MPNLNALLILQSYSSSARRNVQDGVLVPRGLILCKDLSLGMVADDPDVDEGSQVELLGSEHGHVDGVRS